MNTAPRAMTVGHELKGMRPMKAKPSPAAATARATATAVASWMVVQGMPVMSRASLLKMTMPAVLAAAASPMRMPGTDSVPSRADAFSKSRPPTTMANPTITGIRRRSLNRRGDSAMVMTGAVAARTAPRPTPSKR